MLRASGCLRELRKRRTEVWKKHRTLTFQIAIYIYISPGLNAPCHRPRTSTTSTKKAFKCSQIYSTIHPSGISKLHPDIRCPYSEPFSPSWALWGLLWTWQRVPSRSPTANLNKQDSETIDIELLSISFERCALGWWMSIQVEMLTVPRFLWRGIRLVWSGVFEVDKIRSRPSNAMIW